jgi:hypothetical protein
VAKFDLQQAAAVVAIQQLVHEWAHELDVHNGLQHMAELLTEDCRYNVAGSWRENRAEVQKFYKDRYARLQATEEGVPFHRHALHNLRTSFKSEELAAVEFGLIYFTTAGVAAKQDHSDPALVSDVQMECRREHDGHWRISRFESALSFRRAPK